MMMIRPKFPRTVPVSLTQQESDFTAEGSPPPGDASSAPMKPKQTATLASKVAAPPIRKGPPAGKSRWQR